MNFIKKEDKDFTTLPSIANDKCGWFKLAELNPDNFKFLLFVQGSVSGKDAEIWWKVLNKLRNKPNMTLQT